LIKLQCKFTGFATYCMSKILECCILFGKTHQYCINRAIK
jgi:hypothetical protein